MIISYEQEKVLLKTLFSASGMTDEDAGILAEVPAYSDFCGVESHGLSRAIGYVKMLNNGAMNPRPEIKATMETDCLIAFDCGEAPGVVAVTKAYGLLKAKAKSAGVALATGCRSSNIGCGGYYARRAADDGLLLVLCANTFPLQAPFGGADPLLGSNPIVVGSPSGGDCPVILDMATTLTAMGKITAASRKGVAIPDNWALDADGKRTTDPKNYHTMLPMAGYKGYGLAVAVDIFSAVLSGAAYGADIGSFRLKQPEHSGWCMLLVDPAKFMPLEEYKARVDDYVSMLKGSRKAENTEEIFLPGEIEYRMYISRLKSGFYIEPTLEAAIMDRARLVRIADENDTLEQLIGSFEKN